MESRLRYMFAAVPLITCLAPCYGQSVKQNYVKTITMMKAYNGEAEGDSMAVHASLVSKTDVQYCDGLGRPTYYVQNGVSPANRSIGALTEYDNAQRMTANWLGTPTSSSLDYPDIRGFKTESSANYGTGHAYTVTVTDALDRKDYSINAGEQWHSGNKIVKTEYMTNGENDVKMYTAPTDKISLVNDGFYEPCMLDGVKTTDEDGHTLEVYTDMFGRKILERRNGDNDTYFVYNTLGQLRYVLSPQYQKEGKKALYAYEYRYDSHGNVTKKILPGCEHIQYWYDNNDRLIAMQDGRMRNNNGNRHFFYVYDGLGRLAVQGSCYGLAHPGDNLAVLDITAPHEKTKDSGGYTIKYPYYLNGPKADIVNYYDNYDFVEYCCVLKNLPADSLKYEPVRKPVVEGSVEELDYGKGQLTGQLVVDSDKEYVLTVFFYDIRGNVIASRSVSSNNTYMSTNTEYTFLNTVRRTTQTLIKGFGTQNGTMYRTCLANTYDEKSGKLLFSDLTVTDGNSSKTQRIASHEYDDLGRVSKLVQGSGAHSTSYSYDLHGWTTSVAGDAFTESIGYALGANPCYNGSISSMEWMNADDRLARSYAFMYDGLNRLTDATYDDAGGGKNHYNETVRYNQNGSPLTIMRNGKNDSGQYKTIDNLSLQYNGNRLRKVTDKGEACTANGTTDFNDGADVATEYTYDACGSLTSDANKGIAKISYNYWGTPTLIQFTNGSQTKYVYDANGIKLRRIHLTAVDNIVVPINTTVKLSENQILSSDTTDYLGDLIFENGKLDKILFSGGYVSCDDNNSGKFTFHYYAKDHLGNNRVVVSESGAIEQTTNYYPFGNSFADVGKNPSLQQYKYNGKELDRMHGLDWYDYGARNYDPVILQWNGVDQLCEDYYHVSPYVYCLNNPVNAFDSYGLFPKFLITRRNTPFYRADYYTLNSPAYHLLSLVSGVPENYIRNAQIMQRGLGHYYPLYSSNDGGGAITLGNSPDNISINFTPNYFEDDKEQYNGHGYGQDFYSWMTLLSHEVGHIKHIEDSKNELSYIIGFGLDYLKYGHDDTPREKEAERGSEKFIKFNDFVNEKKGKNALEDLFKSNKTSELQIRIIDEWWSEYEKR